MIALFDELKGGFPLIFGNILLSERQTAV